MSKAFFVFDFSHFDLEILTASQEGAESRVPSIQLPPTATALSPALLTQNGVLLMRNTNKGGFLQPPSFFFYVFLFLMIH